MEQAKWSGNHGIFAEHQGKNPSDHGKNAFNQGKRKKAEYLSIP